MDFMSILGRCLLLPFPVAMFIGSLFFQADDRLSGMLMSVAVGCLSWYVTRPTRQQMTGT
ncbi:hypothetical protein JZ09_21195 [Salmonella enterica]|uniref:hypothetical protein n=1 Tax=Escherichia coli TaxID=562 RepID=UPI0005A8A274|nr:hypothetical protein [Escherichia coli]EBP0522525.1 hypothetical protein [Salmonella enterica]EBV6531219.1 hypothetical protein [Salmonella enterica subsp. enterica serovar Oranienburg]ECG2309519.1 hypothetical protein [Salmonella enterica subsp. enterica serovar Tennessee]EED3792879.1 hypothetical protein [Salmonella enterica subsp. enterica serovar Oranienburg]EET8849681.1 hypothetical protein [Escherichia coli]